MPRGRPKKKMETDETQSVPSVFVAVEPEVELVWGKCDWDGAQIQRTPEPHWQFCKGTNCEDMHKSHR